MENLKNIAPLSDFDWNAFENGVVESSQSHDEQEKAYDNTLGNFLLRNVFLDPLANNNINFASNYDRYLKAATKLLGRTTDGFKSILEAQQ